MLFWFLEFSSILSNYLMYFDYFQIQLVFDPVMDLWKVKYIKLKLKLIYISYRLHPNILEIFLA